MLRDATNERTACGREQVLAVLLRWSRAALLTLTLTLALARTLALALTLALTLTRSSAARGRVHRVTRAG